MWWNTYNTASYNYGSSLCNKNGSIPGKNLFIINEDTRTLKAKNCKTLVSTLLYNQINFYRFDLENITWKMMIQAKLLKTFISKIK